MTLGHARVLLVGASTPIGRAITARFVAGRAQVVGASLESAGDPALTRDLVVDCSTADGAEVAVTGAVEALGGLDVVITAAGRQSKAPVHETTDEQWRMAYAGAVDVLFCVSRAALPLLSEGATIVAISSVNASRPAPWFSAYATAKAAVEALVRSLAVDYGASGIRVNAVAPGLVPIEPDASLTAGYPLHRIIQPADVASAVYFLASAEAAAITGITLPVDGGLGIAAASTAARPNLSEQAATRLIPPRPNP